METASRKPESLAERFWSIARARERAGDNPETLDPVSVVNHVLAILDEVDSGHVGDELSVNTVSFLHLLRVHEMGGDLSYASPEQIGGAELDERSLVFSIGVLIFERLTGRHPFGAAGNPRRRVARISKVEFGSGINYFPTVPSGLRTVLMKAMGPFPEERWNSLKELRAALEYFADRSQPAVRLPGTGDDEKTQIFRPGVGANVIEQAVGSHGVGTVHEHSHPNVSAEDRTLRLLRRSARRWMPVLWLGVGAAVASAAFLIAGSSDEADPETYAASVAQPMNAAKPVNPTASPPEPVAEPATEASARPAARPEAAVSAAAEPAVASVEPAASSPRVKPIDGPGEDNAPAEFSPQRGGDRAASAVGECFSPARLAGSGVVVGLSIRFRADGSIQKLYYASDTRLSPAEVSCMREKLLGFSAGPAKKAQVIGYRLRVSAETREALISGP